MNLLEEGFALTLRELVELVEEKGEIVETLGETDGKSLNVHWVLKWLL